MAAEAVRKGQSLPFAPNCCDLKSMSAASQIQAMPKFDSHNGTSCHISTTTMYIYRYLGV